MVRTRWAGVARGPDELSSAFALESTLDEVAFVLGPPLATALAVAVAPWSAIVTGLLLAASGALALAAQRSTEPDPPREPRCTAPAVWRSGTLQVLTLLMVLMGAIFGALEVSTVAFRAGGRRCGPLGGSWACSPCPADLTGLYLGARPGGWPLSGQVLVGHRDASPAATAAIPFIDGLGWYAAGMFAAGLGVSGR